MNQNAALCLAAMVGGIYLLQQLSENWFESWLKGPKKKKARELNPNTPLDPSELGRFPLELLPGKRYSDSNPLHIFLSWWHDSPWLKEPLVLGEDARYQHIEVLGSSGTGKTRHFILPSICRDIHQNAGVAAWDVKSNMKDRIAIYAQRAGRLDDFLAFDVTNPAKSHTYSPLVGDDPTEIANRVWTAFYQDDKAPTPFYRDSALSFLRSFMNICSGLKVLPTLIQLHQCVTSQEHLEALISLDRGCYRG